jgi:two-component system sensor histidine kinase KdpD
VEVSIPDDFVSIPMDAVLIEQVLTNLLENAVIHASGMTKLELIVETNGTAVSFHVRDDGCGIPDDRMEDLFTGYLGSSARQGDSSRRNMGIGLSVCATIIKAHGGSISARNRAPRGAEFTFTLNLEE